MFLRYRGKLRKMRFPLIDVILLPEKRSLYKSKKKNDIYFYGDSEIAESTVHM